MGYKIQDSDIEISRNAGVSEDDIKHCVKVAKKLSKLLSESNLTLIWI